MHLSNTDRCLCVCDVSDLLLSKSDGIEVGYNACGVIANLMSDGPAAWTAVTPSRYKVLDRMVLAITSWPLSQKRNINYRSIVVVYLPYSVYISKVRPCIPSRITRILYAYDKKCNYIL